MRNLILAIAATATLGAMSVTADALPTIGSNSLAPAVTVNGAIQKTDVVIIKKAHPMRKICKTIVTMGKTVTRCHMG